MPDHPHLTDPGADLSDVFNGVIKSDPFQFQHMAALREQRFESVQAKGFTDTMREFLAKLNAGQQLDAG